MERRIDCNTGVSGFLNEISVENNNPINTNDKISGVAVKVSYHSWQYTVI